jgi:hypothetical protein
MEINNASRCEFYRSTRCSISPVLFKSGPGTFTKNNLTCILLCIAGSEHQEAAFQYAQPDRYTPTAVIVETFHFSGAPSTL